MSRLQVKKYPNISNTLKGTGENGGDLPGWSGDCQECQTIKRGHQNNDTLQDVEKCQG
ncbi:Uncharacterised protein [uncultured Ruminococcus sp.]|nr:Uncharacterised protein [uncultured Ruminococcus sp.]